MQYIFYHYLFFSFVLVLGKVLHGVESQSEACRRKRGQRDGGGGGGQIPACPYSPLPQTKIQIYGKQIVPLSSLFFSSTVYLCRCRCIQVPIPRKEEEEKTFDLQHKRWYKRYKRKGKKTKTRKKNTREFSNPGKQTVFRIVGNEEEINFRPLGRPAVDSQP